MKIFRMPSPAAPHAHTTQRLASEMAIEHVRNTPRGSDALAISDLPQPEKDPFLYQDQRWCANCGGARMFVPVDRFPHGWRGYCLGCEEVVYVMDSRTCA